MNNQCKLSILNDKTNSVEQIEALIFEIPVACANIDYVLEQQQLNGQWNYWIHSTLFCPCYKMNLINHH